MIQKTSENRSTNQDNDKTVESAPQDIIIIYVY